MRYLENTIASIEAAFAAGADIVEFDVHPTTDGHFAVFHDWTVDCRTEGHGVTREHTLAELKALDIGYGYTADGGKTFPFRGKGVGLMPSLDEVLAAFPMRRLLINVKSNDPDGRENCWASTWRASQSEQQRAASCPTAVTSRWRRCARRLPELRSHVARLAQELRLELPLARVDRICAEVVRAYVDARTAELCVAAVGLARSFSRSHAESGQRTVFVTWGLSSAAILGQQALTTKIASRRCPKNSTAASGRTTLISSGRWCAPRANEA